MNSSNDSGKKTQRETRKEETVDYLDVLEEVKEQYQQYIEVSGIYDLNRLLEPKDEEYLPPTPENPLATNKFVMKQSAIME